MREQMKPISKFSYSSCNRSALWPGKVIGSRDTAQADAWFYVGKRRPTNNGAALFPIRKADPFIEDGTDHKLDEEFHSLA